jgi:prephenate dehydrogenase
LFRDAAAAAHQHLPLADLIANQLHLAQEAGMKDVEWAAGQYRIAQSVAGSGSGEQGDPGFNIG